MIDPTDMARYLKIAGSRTEMLSESKELSPLQEGYAKVIQGLMTERELDSPFSQSPSEIANFFNEASRRWEQVRGNYE